MGILGATFFFGFAAALTVTTAKPSLRVIPVILKVFTYVVTLLALIFFLKNNASAPRCGRTLRKGQALNLYWSLQAMQLNPNISTIPF